MQDNELDAQVEKIKIERVKDLLVRVKTTIKSSLKQEVDNLELLSAINQKILDTKNKIIQEAIGNIHMDANDLLIAKTLVESDIIKVAGSNINKEKDAKQYTQASKGGRS